MKWSVPAPYLVHYTGAILVCRPRPLRVRVRVRERQCTESHTPGPESASAAAEKNTLNRCNPGGKPEHTSEEFKERNKPQIRTFCGVWGERAPCNRCAALIYLRLRLTRLIHIYYTLYSIKHSNSETVTYLRLLSAFYCVCKFTHMNSNLFLVSVC